LVTVISSAAIQPGTSCTGAISAPASCATSKAQHPATGVLRTGMEAAGRGEHLYHPGQQLLGTQLFGRGALDILGQGFLQAFQFDNPCPEETGTDKAFCRGLNLLEGDARHVLA